MSERRTDLEQALRHAARAAKQGNHTAADRWSKTAERLAAAEAAEVEREELKQAQAEEIVCVLFTKVAFLANVMVHEPHQAPAAFQHLIKLWRQENLGEGEEDADRAAAKLAASKAAFLEGRWEDTLPEYVREHLKKIWRERCAAMEGKPIVPKYWEDEAE